MNVHENRKKIIERERAPEEKAFPQLEFHTPHAPRTEHSDHEPEWVFPLVSEVPASVCSVEALRTAPVSSPTSEPKIPNHRSKSIVN